MQKHSIENFCLITYGKFSKIVTFWTEKVIYIQSGADFRGKSGGHLGPAF